MLSNFIGSVKKKLKFWIMYIVSIVLIGHLLQFMLGASMLGYILLTFAAIAPIGVLYNLVSLITELESIPEVLKSALKDLPPLQKPTIRNFLQLLKTLYGITEVKTIIANAGLASNPVMIILQATMVMSTITLVTLVDIVMIIVLLVG